VIAAHDRAPRLYANRAIASQVPMLLLMITYTIGKLLLLFQRQPRIVHRVLARAVLATQVSRAVQLICSCRARVAPGGLTIGMTGGTWNDGSWRPFGRTIAVGCLEENTMELAGELARIRRKQRRGTQQEVVIVDTPRARELDKTDALLRGKLPRLISHATHLGKKDVASPADASFTLVEKSEHNTVRADIAEVGTLLGKVAHERAARAIVVKGKTSI
jgi:hypothetical protein